MQRFAHDGVDIAFLDEGAGAPIVLVHGFASTAQVNWRHPGWVGTLSGAGRRVIALDNRGHGASSELYDPAAYHSATMADESARCSIISPSNVPTRHRCNMRTKNAWQSMEGDAL